jgi:hypothetical protein
MTSPFPGSRAKAVVVVEYAAQAGTAGTTGILIAGYSSTRLLAQRAAPGSRSIASA